MLDCAEADVSITSTVTGTAVAELLTTQVMYVTCDSDTVTMVFSSSTTVTVRVCGKCGKRMTELSTVSNKKSYKKLLNTCFRFEFSPSKF